MWSGFFAAVLGGIAAIVSVILGWFFNQHSKTASIRKALQLEIDTNWRKLEGIRKEIWPSGADEYRNNTTDQERLKAALHTNRVTLSGWQSSVWTNNLVQIVSALGAQDLKRVQEFYQLLERLEHLANRDEPAEAMNALLQLYKGNKPDITAKLSRNPILDFIRTKI